ncbi:hypothetical protein [Pseudomethylobacillus aquaticus]|nr:hypothetical protein [Pseudomethylobacillus aquaticus]
MKTDDVKNSELISSFLQNLKQDPSTAPRMLTQVELHALRLYKAEIHKQVRELMRAAKLAEPSAKELPAQGGLPPDDPVSKLNQD